MNFIQNLKCPKIMQLPRRAVKSLRELASSATVNAKATERSVDSLASTLSAADTYGQPTYATHPHLINEGELAVGVAVDEFQQRRQRLMQSIQKFTSEYVKNVQQSKLSHLVIVPSSAKKYMSDKIPYVFRQNSDFYYLTGCLEPDTVLMMNIDNTGALTSTLFMRPKDKHAELWDGARTGVDNAVHLFGVDEAYTSEQFECQLNDRIARSKPVLWYDTKSMDLPNITSSLQQVNGNLSMLNSPAKFIQSMRLFKSAAEQSLMRRTCAIASEAINEVMREARPGYSEHHIYAMVDYKCRMKNANYLAYPPVVASGGNATTIHYINNSQLTKCGDMVLMDAGCEYGGYTSDITRTWPISGSFTEPQRVLYEVVLQLQKDLIDTVFLEGGETLDKLFDTMCIKLGKYLQEVGLVRKDITDPVGYAKAGYKFCPHHVSHYLGMDVHDTPLIPRNIDLLPGMVFTIEPGIYVGHDCADVPQEFRGIGVRVEDDILITGDKQIEVLTEKCIKDRVQLENLFKEKLKYH